MKKLILMTVLLVIGSAQAMEKPKGGTGNAKRLDQSQNDLLRDLINQVRRLADVQEERNLIAWMKLAAITKEGPVLEGARGEKGQVCDRKLEGEMLRIFGKNGWLKEEK